MDETTHTPPTLDDIRATAREIGPYVVRTPVQPWSGRPVASRLGEDTRVHLKMELWQRTGTFKARGAVNNVRALDAAQLERGITAISAGNHAIATAYAGRCFGAQAKVVMIKTANPARIAAARSWGAEVLMAEDGSSGFRMVEEIAEREGRAFIHPFEGPRVTFATATCGLELMEDVPDLDAVVVPIGGGGLCSGLGTAVKLVNPRCKVYGVEPEGTQVMTRSLAAGSAQRVDKLDTIADSLAPPMTTPYCFAMCSACLDDVVLVTDDEMTAAMAILFDEMKLALEPAAAASTAAAFGPLREQLRGLRVALVICGTNIDADTFHSLVSRGRAARERGILAI